MLDSIIFWVFAVLSLFGALGVVFHRSIIYSALFLIIVFLSIAAFFMLNNADFLAIAQVIIYAVGLTIILMFGVMFTGDRPFAESGSRLGERLAYGVVSFLTFGVLAAAVSYPFVQQVAPLAFIQRIQTEGSTRILGYNLFSTFGLPFELASILLTIALIGAIILAKKTFAVSPEGTNATLFDINHTSRHRPFDDASAAYWSQTTLPPTGLSGSAGNIPGVDGISADENFLTGAASK